jgi:hypothetical protein
MNVQLGVARWVGMAAEVGRTEPSIAGAAEDHSWRILPVSAYGRFLAVFALSQGHLERVLRVDSVEKPLNRPLAEKWFRRCDSLV